MYTFNTIPSLRGVCKAGAALALLTATAGCIHNDIPYPWVHANILSFEVEGQIRSAAIDSTDRVVTVYLGEDVNPAAVKVSGYTISPMATITPENAFDGTINLLEPYDVTLTIYQDYPWTITAQQTIQRYFTVDNEIGTSVIDEANHTVTAIVPDQVALDAITVTSVKLGGPQSTISPSLTDGPVDFTEPVKVTVTEWGRQQEWTITITQTAMSVYLTSVDAWTRVAYLHGSAGADKIHGFKYREAGYETWTDVPATDIVSTGGSFTARIAHLKPESTYEAVATAGDDSSMPMTFTTGTEAQMDNSDFRDWWLDDKVWNPWSETGTSYWDTGNKGATTLGTSNTTPIADSQSPTGYLGAQLESRFVGISILGKLAAGNLFTGQYVKTDGTNGILAFGREFTQRPTRLTGKWKYNDVNITHASTELAALKGQPDTCTVWMALIDSDEPYEIRTNPNNRKLFEPDGPEVVAYGKVESGKSIDDFTDFTVELEYRSTSRVPKYIIVVSSASKYGDYFTGGNGSCLWVKDYKLEYDY